jgi:hypothetical protein
MKRIPNKTAVATICFCISGNQHVVIYDYENEYDLLHEQNGNLVVDGKLKDVAYNWRFGKYFDSECKGIKIEDGTIVFSVYTKYEQYK